MSTFVQLQKLKAAQPELIPLSKKALARKRRKARKSNQKNGLPFDIWKLICSYLSSKDIISLSQTNTLFTIFADELEKCLEEISTTWNSMVWTAKCKAKSTIGPYDYGSVATENLNLVCSIYPQKHHSLKVEYAYNTRGLSFYRWYLDNRCEGCTDG